MPNPRDFMPAGSTYVRGYVRGQSPPPKRKSKLPAFIFIGGILVVFIILFVRVGPPVLFGLLGVGVLWFIATHPPRKRKQRGKIKLF